MRREANLPGHDLSREVERQLPLGDGGRELVEWDV
jgi:hypothetical protein